MHSLEKYLALAELECPLVPAHLQQLCDPLLIGGQAHDLLHNVPHKFDALAEPLHASTSHCEMQDVCLCLRALQLRSWQALFHPWGWIEAPKPSLDSSVRSTS